MLRIPSAPQGPEGGDGGARNLGLRLCLRIARLQQVAVGIEHLGWAPAGGRPARFLGGRSVQARIRARKVEALAHEVGLPHLREYVLKQHVVLYAHSSDRVVLLALRHHRQLSYMV